MSWFWCIRVLTILSSNYICDCKQVSWSGFHWTPFSSFNLRNYYGISFLWDKTCGSVGLLESRTLESDYDLSPNWILTYPSNPMVMLSPCLRFLTYYRLRYWDTLNFCHFSDESLACPKNKFSSIRDWEGICRIHSPEYLKKKKKWN